MMEWDWKEAARFIEGNAVMRLRAESVRLPMDSGCRLRSADVHAIMVR
jgi:hypothetical protein